MDLHDIHEKTKLEPRKLRYVLDHGVLPGTRVKADTARVGHPRSFTEFEGFSITVAAALLEAGLRRELVAKFFDAMVDIHWTNAGGPNKRKRGPLEAAFGDGSARSCILADGRYLSLSIGERTEGWLDLQSPKFNTVEYQPRVTVSIDLAGIRREILA